MDTEEAKLAENTPSGEMMADGLPKILPPYENGIFQAVLTLPEAHDALARYRDTISAITKAKGGIAVANETLLTISQDANERARYRSRRIWLQDREHERAVALKEGRAEMRAEYEPLLASKDAEIASKDAEIASKDAEIAALRAKLNEGQ